MKLAALSIAALLATGMASAYETSSIDAVQAQQRHRIEHGRNTGQLRWREYLLL